MTQTDIDTPATRARLTNILQMLIDIPEDEYANLTPTTREVIEEEKRKYCHYLGITLCRHCEGTKTTKAAEAPDGSWITQACPRCDGVGREPD